jgi:cyclopropane-fatty-acyl-phospholipid synthase
MWYIGLAERNLVPDWLLRLTIRSALALGRWHRARATAEERNERKRALLARLAQSPIAIRTHDPNAQHYEVPTAFYQLVLGKWLKYSCAYWPPGVGTLDKAEEGMLELTCQRAQIENGMSVLDLGCGWGAVTLWVAENYPDCHVLAISNSRTQKRYIDSQCRLRQLENVEVMTADVVDLQLKRRFDRIVSVEMFEHMKNYGLLLARLASLLEPDGKLFVHIFSHRYLAYEFDASDPNNWMAQTFFSGGTMPSDDLLLYFQRDLWLQDHWCLDGTHYARTLRAWLQKLDSSRPQVLQTMVAAYGADQAAKWLSRWRLFFLLCECAWGSNGGREYLVSHYLFTKAV